MANILVNHEDSYGCRVHDLGIFAIDLIVEVMIKHTTLTLKKFHVVERQAADSDFGP